MDQYTMEAAILDDLREMPLAATTVALTQSCEVVSDAGTTSIAADDLAIALQVLLHVQGLLTCQEPERP